MFQQLRMSLLGLAALFITATMMIPPHAPHGDPRALGTTRPVIFSIAAPKAGIKAPVQLTTMTAFTPSAVRARLEIRPRIPVLIRALGPHHFLIMPRKTWPGNSIIRFHWAHTNFRATLATDDGRWLAVDLSTQTLIAGENGRIVRTLPVSTGVPPRWSTPPGTFWIYRRVVDDHMVGGQGHDRWDVPHVPYAQYFNGAIAFHGAWWNHRFGRPASHGCVQLSTNESPWGPTGDPANAEWLWHFADIGTPVIVYGHTPRISRDTPLTYPSPALFRTRPSIHPGNRANTRSAATSVRSMSSSL
ncbi:MAG: L,D-transpeptidase [Firmicutes bacterium]|nr:L,D-transpeptidase [Bacillota bacterium]